MTKDLLELRNELKQKKPVFLRQDGHKKVKLKKAWRQPKGMHSKKRNKMKGHGKHPSIGYRSPKSVRGLTRTGLIPARIFNESDLSNLTNKHCVVLGKSLGTDARLNLLKLIKLKGLTLHQVDIDWYITKIESQIKSKNSKKQPKKVIVKEEPKKEQQKEKTVEEKQEELKKQKQKILSQGL